VFDRIAGKDHHRRLLIEAAVEQRLRDGADLAVGVGIGQQFPTAEAFLCGAALAEPGAVRRLGRPFTDRFDEVCGDGAQRMRIAQHDRAVGAVLDLDFRFDIAGIAEGRQVHVQGFRAPLRR